MKLLFKLFKRNKVNSPEEYFTQVNEICKRFDQSTQKLTQRM